MVGPFFMTIIEGMISKNFQKEELIFEKNAYFFQLEEVSI